MLKHAVSRCISELRRFDSNPTCVFTNLVNYFYHLIHLFIVLFNPRPGRVAQSVGHLTRKTGVLGSKPLSGNILSFLLPLFQEGQLSVTGESMCTKYWLTA